MKRRDFLKYVGVGGAGTGLGYMFGKMSKPPVGELIPYLVPPEDIIPGVANWYASLCTQCSAGCGTIVKVMEGRAKKIEGNPLHPVNKGGLCARGQASLNVLYNPDRIKGPLKRNGKRGEDKFEEISWEEGISILSKNLSELNSSAGPDRLTFLTSNLRGHLHSLISKFMKSFGSPNYHQYELFQPRDLAFANKVTMGIEAIPHYDISNTDYLLSFGADFSTTWLSPVNYSRGYGHMRQGKQGKRGKLTQIEPRMSISGANADEWIPARPGTEGILALSIAHVMVEKGVYSGSDSSSWKDMLSGFKPENVAPVTDVTADKIKRIAEEFSHSRSSLAIGGDNLAGYDNGISCLVAINILNYLAGRIGSEGGVLQNPEGLLSGTEKGNANRVLSSIVSGASNSKIDTLMIYNTNPLFTTTKEMKLVGAMSKIPLIVSFSSFMDETTAMADLILPAHTSLEDWGDDFADPGVGFNTATIMQPAVAPLHNTKGLGDILLATAKRIGGDLKKELAWDSFEGYLQESWRDIYTRDKKMKASAASFDEFWNRTLQYGGWWPEETPENSKITISVTDVKEHITSKPSTFDGEAKDYPFYLITYPQSGLYDGRGANLPWLQELPDPITSVVWGSWVEINPETADKLMLKEGEVVFVESPYGKVEVPVYINPGIRPDTLAIPIGQGHKTYGRYAKNRGVNPIEILPFKEDSRTGTVALNSTRVRVSRSLKSHRMVKMEGTTRELGRGIVQTVSPGQSKHI